MTKKAKSQPTEFRAVPHHDKKSGWRGEYKPVTPAAKKAAAKGAAYLLKKGLH